MKSLKTKNSFYLTLINLVSLSFKILRIRKKILSSKKILEQNYPQGSEFRFIQVGANDGISFDFLYEFVISRNSKGIVIEPIKEYFDELCKNYSDFPDIVKVNLAVHQSEKKVIINRISPESANKYPDWVKGIGSIDVDHHKKTGVIDSKDIIQEEVSSENLMDIISIFSNINYINYLQIDTEGFDFEVLKMIDFNKIKPEIIKYEYVNLKKEDQKAIQHILKKQGYHLIKEYGDIVAISLDKIKLF